MSIRSVQAGSTDSTLSADEVPRSIAAVGEGIAAEDLGMSDLEDHSSPSPRTSSHGRDEDNVGIELEVWLRNRAPFRQYRLSGFQYTATTNYANHRHANLGLMNRECSFCHALLFKGERSSLCCGNGKIDLDPIPEPPQPLQRLMLGESRESKEFLLQLRMYNNAFSMISFGTNAPGENLSGWRPEFKIQGQVYHLCGSLLADNESNSHFIQIYFIGDPNVSVDNRLSSHNSLDRIILVDLHSLLMEHNRLLNLFKTQLEMMPTDEHMLVIRQDKAPLGAHRGRYNAPTSDEIAILLNVDSICKTRDIILRKRGGDVSRVPETNRSYDALQYPLILWDGQDGYHFNLREVNPRTRSATSAKLSAMDYYNYRIMFRKDDFNHLLRCKSLFSQYIVDMWAKVETERLIYLRTHQRELRAEEYVHLRDAMATDGNIENLGQHVILPSTFIGSPRHMAEYSQDAICYVRLYGKPCFFITFTCNPKWPEITDNLLPGQKPHDRHDLIARVFHAKLNRFMFFMRDREMFGKLKAFVSTIEWQKRGLPHCHMLFWLAERLRPDQTDLVVSAEIPDPRTEPELHSIVTSQLMHGPCGLINPNSPCMRDNRCRFGYPKRLVETTQLAEDGYPLYRRRSPENTGRSITRVVNGNDFTMTNEWVVPYNPVLCLLFNAHINVELCHSVRSIKYICKYINKGQDMAVVGLNGRDEISNYQLCRYIGSNEAAWKLMSFPIHTRFPPVIKLQVHLENGQRVYFNELTAWSLAQRPPSTTLTAFFELCRRDSFAENLLYCDVPKFYTWQSSRKFWAVRKKGRSVPGHPGYSEADVIGRVFVVHPRNVECFYLRILLHEIRGPTSFTHLKEFNGIQYDTYREACLARGLLVDDRSWTDAIRESCISSSPEQIRELFAVILTCCQPIINSQSIWDEFKEFMCEDVLNRYPDRPERVYTPAIFDEGLRLLNRQVVALSGKTIDQLGLRAPSSMVSEAIELFRERDYNIEHLETFVSNNCRILTPEQLEIFRSVCHNFDTGTGGLFFLDAPGGTGKTFLLSLILAYVRSKQCIALAVAASGIAATLLEGGRTAHTTFNIPVNVHQRDTPICSISLNSAKAQIMRECKVIIWDECTMSHKKAFEAVDQSLKRLRNNENVFGGVLTILSGDFRQTLPVVERGRPSDEYNACIKTSYLWPHVNFYRLTINMRAALSGIPDIGTFVTNLMMIGNGQYPIFHGPDLVVLNRSVCVCVNSLESLFTDVFPDFANNCSSFNWLAERAILTPHNNSVDTTNQAVLDRMPGVSQIFYSIDVLTNEEQAVNYPTEFLNSLNPSGSSLHKLELKIGAPILCLRNLNAPKLCNGTKLIITNLSRNVIFAKIVIGPFKGTQVMIPRIPMILNHGPIEYKRMQFPVKLAFAMTINKAQGQTLSTVGINLEHSCFSHGQLYVACSRVGHSSKLFIYAPQQKTRNVVYTYALQ